MGGKPLLNFPLFIENKSVLMQFAYHIENYRPRKIDSRRLSVVKYMWNKIDYTNVCQLLLSENHDTITHWNFLLRIQFNQMMDCQNRVPNCEACPPEFQQTLFN